MILSLLQLQQVASSKPEGYLEDILSLAKTQGDAVELSEIDYQNLRKKYQALIVQTGVVTAASECGCCNKVKNNPVPQ